MKTLGSMLCLVLLAAGCANVARPAAPAATTSQSTFTGEVWTWDEQANTVTLRQGTGTIRVKVSPQQMAGLRLHQVVTLRGELAGPADIETTMIPMGALVPRGGVDQFQVGGTVSSLDPAGKVTVASQPGPLTLWIAHPGSTPFKAGQRVQVRVRVQPFDIVPGEPAQLARAEPKASVGSEPGEYAAVKGRITAIEPDGRLTVESPRGPVTLAVANASRYRVGDFVEAHTSVHPAR